jgi:ketosteroid isomerase-like protein
MRTVPLPDPSSVAGFNASGRPAFHRRYCAPVTATAPVLALLEAVGRGDVDAMGAQCTEDFVLEMPYADPPKVVEGRQQVGDYLRRVFQVFEIRLEVTELYECPDRDTVIAEYASQGLVKTTGRTYANRYICVFILRGGKIARQREFYNPLPAAEATRPL